MTTSSDVNSIFKQFIKKIQLCFFVAFYLFPFYLSSQVAVERGAPLIKNFRNGIEIPNSQNWTAIQDRRGIMFIGVDDGIVEFDGIESRYIRLPSVIRSFCYGKDSLIYCAGDYEFGYLTMGKNGQTEYVSLYKKVKDKRINSTQFVKTYSTNEGVFFLSDSLIVKYDYKGFKTFPILLDSRYGNEVNNELFIFLKGKGIFLFKEGKPNYLPHTEKIIQDAGKIEVLPYKKNKLLIVTKNKGLFIYHYDQLKLHSWEDSQPETRYPKSLCENLKTETEDYLIKNIVYPSAVISEDIYAFGTITGGVILMDAAGNLLRIINETRGLYDNIIFHIYVDRHKNLWVTSSNGISYIELSNPLNQFKESSSLNSTVSRGIIDAKVLNNRLYITYSKGALCLSSHKLKISDDKPDFKEIIPIKGRTSPLYQYKSVFLAEADDKLYVIHDSKARVLLKTFGTFSMTKSTALKDYFFYSSDQIGLGYFKLQLDKTAKSPEEIFAKLKASDVTIVPNMPSLLKVLEDETGNLLLVSRKDGLLYLKFKNYSIDKYETLQLNHFPSVPATDYANLFEFDNNVFIPTQHKLLQAKLGKRGDWSTIRGFGRQKIFGEELNKDSFKIYMGGSITKTQCWIHSSRGLLILSKNKDGSISSFNIPIGDTPIYSVSIDETGLIWITARNNIFSYDPKILKSYNTPFKTLIRKVSIGQDSVIFYGTHKVINKKKKARQPFAAYDQPLPDIPKINFDNNSISIQYASGFYESSDHTTYRTILKGFDTKWSNWGTETKKEYNYLPPGHYCFKVEAKNVYGVKGSRSSYCFIINPPWYRTIWAYLGYAVFLILVFVLGAKFYTRKLLDSKKKLEQIIETRTREISNKNEELSKSLEEIKELENFKESMINMIVHDLKSPLNNIIGYSSKGHEYSDTIVMNSSKNMLNMVETILNVHKFEKSRIKLNVEIHNVREIVKMAILDMSFVAIEKNIKIINNVVDESFLFDAELIKRVIINILNNAIKFSPEKETILINYEIVEKEETRLFKLLIHDKGKGIPADMKDKIFDKYVQVEARKLGIAHSTGLGLTFCKMVVEEHRGKIEVESELGRGSTFSITLPLIN